MIWIIASVPFWVCGALFFIGGCVWMVDGARRVEPKVKSCQNLLVGLLGSGIFFLIAAKIAS